MVSIAFFSTKEELEFLKEHADFNQLHLVALTPEADFWGSQLKLRYKAIEDYYNECSLNIKGIQSIPIIEGICKVLDNSIETEKEKFSTCDFFMFLKLLYDQLLITHTFCQGLMKRERPNKIILVNVPPLRSELIVSNNDDLVLNVIYYYFQCKKVECQLLSFEKTAGALVEEPISITSKFICWLSRIKASSINRFYNLINFRAPALLIAQAYDFEACKGLQKFFKIYTLPAIDKKNKKNLKQTTTNTDNQKKTMRALEKSFTLDDVSYFKIIMPKLYYIVSNIKSFMQCINQNIHNYLRKKKIKALIAGSGQSLEILASLRAACNFEIPIVWGQHGGLYGYGDVPITKQLNKLYTHYFLYAKGSILNMPKKPSYIVSSTTLQKIYYAKRIAD
jgi:hypothetical protein